MKTAFLFDLDGTITKQELLPLIALELFIQEEIQTLTDATLKGVIPFEGSFKLRVGLLKTVRISRVKEILASVELNAVVQNFIQKNRENSFIVTGNLDVWVESLVEKIGVKAFTSEAEFTGDSLLSIKKILKKRDAVIEIKNNNFDRVVTIGESMNDVGMFEMADIGIAYGGVHQPMETIIELSDYIVYHEDALCKLLHTLL